MDAGATNTSTTFARIHSFRIVNPRTAPPHPSATILKVVGLWLGVAVGLPLAVWLVGRKAEGLGGTTLASSLLGIIGFFIHLVILNEPRLRRHRDGRWRLRCDRLGRLLARPENWPRLPHRVVELALLSAAMRRVFEPGPTALSPTDLRPVFPHLAPGTVICAPDRPMHGMHLPAAIPFPFEARDATDPHELATLVLWEKQHRGRTRDWAEDFGPVVLIPRRHAALRGAVHFGDSSARGPAGRRPPRRYLIWIAVAWVFLGLLSPRGPGLALGVLAMLFAVPRLERFFQRGIGYESWLVPGGLVYARRTLGNHRGKALYARRADTPLVFDLSRSVAYCRIGQEIGWVPFGWPHLVAWMASAPSPSVEAVQALVGEETELVVAG